MADYTYQCGYCGQTVYGSHHCRNAKREAFEAKLAQEKIENQKEWETAKQEIRERAARYPNLFQNMDRWLAGLEHKTHRYRVQELDSEFAVLDELDRLNDLSNRAYSQGWNDGLAEAEKIDKLLDS